MKTFLHSGDRGDLVYCLPIIRDNPGILYVADKPWTRPITPWIEQARKLIEAQGYVKSLEVHAGQKINHDFSTFRKIGHHMGRTICELQYTWTKVRCDQNKPWLSVEPSKNTAGRIVVNRTPRYNNSFFPWKELVETFAKDILFIGLPEERAAFCSSYGDVAYLPTNDMYEAAAAIAGSELYIANQSSCYALCEGLKHRSIQETHLQWADCIYARENATYCFDGRLSFDACGKHFESSSREVAPKISTSETPPGGWTLDYPGIKPQKSYAFDSLLIMARQKLKDAGLPAPENLKDIIVEQARGKFPDKGHAGFRRLRELVREKYQKVGLSSPC
jgi:hypothetical protein